LASFALDAYYKKSYFGTSALGSGLAVQVSSNWSDMADWYSIRIGFHNCVKVYNMTGGFHQKMLLSNVIRDVKLQNSFHIAQGELKVDLDLFDCVKSYYDSVINDSSIIEDVTELENVKLAEKVGFIYLCHLYMSRGCRLLGLCDATDGHLSTVEEQLYHDGGPCVSLEYVTAYMKAFKGDFTKAYQELYPTTEQVEDKHDA
jgi:hypothetical protein